MRIDDEIEIGGPLLQYNLRIAGSNLSIGKRASTLDFPQSIIMLRRFLLADYSDITDHPNY